MENLATFASSSVEEGEWVHSAPVAFEGGHAELLAIVKERSFREGEFTLSSGEVSNLYFDMKLTMMFPRGAELSARAFLRLVDKLGVTYVSGLEMGAVPVIGSMAALSSADGKPVHTTFVRKRAKAYGTGNVVEGVGPNDTLKGAKVLVIDDVSTSGRSILQAIKEIRAVGGIVEHAACIVNRAEGGDELLADAGVQLHGLLHVSEFVSNR